MPRIKQPMTEEGIMALILHSKKWAEPSLWYQLIAEELITRRLATPDKAEALANNYVIKCCKRNKNFGKTIFAIGDAQDEAAKRWGNPIIKRRAYVQQHDQIVNKEKKDEEDPRELLVEELFGKTQEDLFSPVVDPPLTGSKTPPIVKEAAKHSTVGEMLLPMAISPSVSATSTETLQTEPGPSEAKGKESGASGGASGGLSGDKGKAAATFAIGGKGKEKEIPRWMMSGPGFAESSDDDDISELNFVNQSVFKTRLPRLDEM
ncbi:hypothetical protein TWF694_000148 [Orbilia ellipsospora]|uniref:Uncharacterized protein n=1 Tax=Orbilia ellipsospora TaxID=2528407 RepID=A0AAV9XP55_9PEZI